MNWPEGNSSVYNNFSINQLNSIEKADTRNSPINNNDYSANLIMQIESPFDSHQEDNFIDFYFERNLSQATSKEGPEIAVADINNDGMEDIFVCGAKGQPGLVYLQMNDSWQKVEQADLIRDQDYEDTACAFFDCDGDGDQDLYVGSGGNNEQVFSNLLNDRLYLNDGKGNFTRDVLALPKSGVNTSVIRPYDYDLDGDLDLFVGSRNIPYNYGISPPSFILNNVGGKFRNVTAEMNQELVQPGLITDAIWVDIAEGKNKELVLVGEWMAPKVFSYTGKVFKKIETNLTEKNGWWFHVNHLDIDNDGDEDLILGNKGQNFYLRPSEENELKLWMADFTGDGTYETVLTQNINGKDKPIASKRDLTEQFSFLKKQNLKHADFANKSIQELFDKDIMNKAAVKTINYSASVIAINEGSGQFTIKELPVESQLSSLNNSVVMDLNGDGYSDLVIGGNNYGYLPQFSRLDASYGGILMNDQNGNFKVVPYNESGFEVKGQVRDMKIINVKGENFIVIGLNNEKPRLFKVQKSSYEL